MPKEWERAEPTDHLIMTDDERLSAAWILHEEQIDVVPYAISNDCSLNEAIEILYAERIQRIGG